MTWPTSDLFEINEAFCSVVLSTIDLLGADADRFNVQGGAVAFGTRSAPRERAWSGRWCTSCGDAAAGSGWRRSAPARPRATRC
jgi:hypothetical protein